MRNHSENTIKQVTVFNEKLLSSLKLLRKLHLRRRCASFLASSSRMRSSLISWRKNTTKILICFEYHLFLFFFQEKTNFDSYYPYFLSSHESATKPVTRNSTKMMLGGARQTRITWIASYQAMKGLRSSERANDILFIIRRRFPAKSCLITSKSIFIV